MRIAIYILICFISINAFARSKPRPAPHNPYLMTYEKFVHLNSDEKQKLLIQMMKLMVELEAKFEREIKTTSAQNLEEKTYVKLLRKLSQFFMEEAVAQELSKMGKQFEDLLKNNKGKTCIYGGWISEVKKYSNGNFYCLHPAQASKDFKAAYDQAANKACPSPGKITCNPVIFGYKQANSKAPFCVDTSYVAGKGSKSHNVSYSCMTEALKETNLPKDQDSRDVRFEKMQEEINRDPALFNSLQSTVFDACVCGKTDMQADYVAYMRPHRTCFGLVNTLKGFNNNRCEAMSNAFNALKDTDTEFVSQWNQFFQDKEQKDFKELSVPPSKDPTAEDRLYQKLMAHDNVKKYCSGDLDIPEEKPVVVPEVKKFECEPLECKDSGKTNSENKKVFSCELKKAFWAEKEPKIPIDLSKLPPEKLKIDIAEGTQDPKLELEIDNNKYSCPAKLPDPVIIKNDNEDVYCKAVCEVKDNANACVISVMKPNEKGEDIAVPDTEYSSPDSSEVNNLKPGKENTEPQVLKIKLKDGTEKNCPVTFKETPGPNNEAKKEFKCETKCVESAKEAQDGKKFYDCRVSKAYFVVDGKEQDPLDYELFKVKEKKDILNDGQTTAMDIQLEDGSAQSCPIELPENESNDDGDLKFTIETKAESSDTTVTVTATLKDKEGKEVSTPSGHHISWTRKGAGVSKIKTESTTSSGAQDSKPEETTIKIPEGEFKRDATSVVEIRVEDDYETCATLVKDDGSTVDGPKCQPIPKKVSSSNNNNNNNRNNNNYNPNNQQQPQQPFFNMRPLNLNTQGIR